MTRCGTSDAVASAGCEAASADATARPRDVSSLADSLIARLAAQRDLLQEMDHRFSSVSALTNSRDTSVSVQVDALGALTGLWLSPQALELGPGALAALIVETAAAAAHEVRHHQDRLIGELNSRVDDARETPLDLWDGSVIQAP